MPSAPINKQGKALERCSGYLADFNRADLDACMGFFHADVRVVLLAGACGDDGPAEDTVVAHGLDAIREGHKLEFEGAPKHEKIVSYLKSSLTPDGTHVLVSYATGADHHKVTYILGDEGKCVCRVVHEIKTTAKDGGRRRSMA